MAGYNFKDPKEVEEFLKNLHIEYQFGCLSEKNPEVCHLLGDYNEAIKVDYDAAAKEYKNNCDKYNYPRSCTKYGEYLYSGRGCVKNILEAYKYMKKGCELNDRKGCLDAGIFAVSTEKLEESREFQVSYGMKMLKKACDADDERACLYLTGIYMRGIDGYVEKSTKDAYVYALKCCEAGIPQACSHVADMHKKGDGVQQNNELAAVFKNRAFKLLKELKENKSQVKFQQGIDS